MFIDMYQLLPTVLVYENLRGWLKPTVLMYINVYHLQPTVLVYVAVHGYSDNVWQFVLTSAFSFGAL